MDIDLDKLYDKLHSNIKEFHYDNLFEKSQKEHSNNDFTDKEKANLSELKDAIYKSELYLLHSIKILRQAAILSISKELDRKYKIDDLLIKAQQYIFYTDKFLKKCVERFPVEIQEIQSEKRNLMDLLAKIKYMNNQGKDVSKNINILMAGLSYVSKKLSYLKR